MDNKNVRGILALAAVTALSFGVILGSKALTKENGTETGMSADADKAVEELETDGAENIEKAVRTETGYMVTVKTKGYGGDIVMNVSFDEEVRNIEKVEVVEQNETENVGSKIAEDEFLSQFAGAEAPVYLPGMNLESESGKENAAEGEGSAESVVLQDGTYEAKTTEPDDSGFIDSVTMTVADGKITEVVWECIDGEGNKKSVLSENGQYTMTEDGPTWKEQSEALGAAVVANQNLEALGLNAEGKTDTVSGVSIYIGGFVSLAEECMREAAGVETADTAPQNGTLIDAVSGATVSSKAAVTGINSAYAFLQSIR